MWTLECDGPLFHDKRLWLRPGTSHLFGRTKQETLRNTESYVLDAKSVSKKHLKLSVAAVKAGTGSQLHTRTEVIIEDFSKLGTTIDDEKISQNTKILKGTEHVIKVAKYEFALRLKWRPVVLSAANLTKLEKQGADPLAWFRTRLEALDIKFVSEYVTGKVTHVVAPKRNVPVVLQGIIHGNYVVTREYVDAIVKAATEEPAPDGEGEPKAPLEKDFEGAWPDPMTFVPAVAGEPVKRDASFLVPNSERADIFYGFTFVFCMKTQYEQLRPVINAGSGKAILYESFQEGKTDPKDFVAFVKNVAGEKGSGELEASTQGKGVVVVRITTKNAEWDAQFVQESDRQLNQRSIEQKEFLDPILTMDTSGLRKQLSEEVDLTSAAVPPSQHSAQTEDVPVKDVAETTSPQAVKSERLTQMRKPIRRPVTQSRFKGFDDFDEEPEPVAAPPPAVAGATRSLQHIPEDTPMEDATAGHPASAPTRTTRQQANANSRKRPTPEPDSIEVMDSILPAAAAMKRRRLNQPDDAPTPETDVPPTPFRRAKSEREIDVLEEVRKRREEEERLAREDAEKLKEAMNGMDIEGPAKLVAVQEMEVTRSMSASASRLSRASSERWDETWNGRPNFKRFRRKGEERSTRREKVIVTVEETRKRDFGIGEEYWLDTASSSRQKERTQRDPTQQSQTLREQREDGPDEDEEDNTQFGRKTQHSKKSQDIVVVDEAGTIGESANTVLSASQPSTRAGTQQSKKRPAPEQAVDPPARKKTRPAWSKDDSDDEDEDEFAFPKSRRAARKR